MAKSGLDRLAIMVAVTAGAVWLWHNLGLFGLLIVGAVYYGLTLF